jgi:hypothetical protein
MKAILRADFQRTIARNPTKVLASFCRIDGVVLFGRNCRPPPAQQIHSGFSPVELRYSILPGSTCPQHPSRPPKGWPDERPCRYTFLDSSRRSFSLGWWCKPSQPTAKVGAFLYRVLWGCFANHFTGTGSDESASSVFSLSPDLGILVCVFLLNFLVFRAGGARTCMCNCLSSWILVPTMRCSTA